MGTFLKSIGCWNTLQHLWINGINNLRKKAISQNKMGSTFNLKINIM